MKSIELKELQNYLPYGLKFISPDDSGVWEMTEIKLYRLRKKITEIWVGGNQKGCPYFKNNYIQKIKPIVRPLSDLAENLHDLKLQPMLELFDICIKNKFNYTDEVLENIFGSMIEVYNNDGFGIVIPDHEGRSHELIYKKTESINEFILNINDVRFEIDQTILFEKLLEWHFDVFGWIDKGLAKDLNTLKK